MKKIKITLIKKQLQIIVYLMYLIKINMNKFNLHKIIL